MAENIKSKSNDNGKDNGKKNYDLLSAILTFGSILIAVGIYFLLKNVTELGNSLSVTVAAVLGTIMFLTSLLYIQRLEKTVYTKSDKLLIAIVGIIYLIVVIVLIVAIVQKIG